MSNIQPSADLSDQIAAYLPYLRRYARTLTGAQESGDRYALKTLEAILSDRSEFEGNISVQVGLFRVFHKFWVGEGRAEAVEDDPARAKAQAHLASLRPNSREALILATVEDFSVKDIAQIMNIPETEVDSLVATARSDMQNAVAGRVLIIEDEPIIAADISAIVEDLGHTVTGVARTRTEAVELGNQTSPDLILADIQLADRSSGIDAVNDLLGVMEGTPVIFITAFPERLLTGERPEPAFLIAKPYQEEQVKSAVSQAMFFASTETLQA